MYIVLFTVAAQEGPGIVVARPGENVELLCNVTGAGGTSWEINGTRYALNQLLMGLLDRHNISGRNIVIEDIMINDVRNGSEYQCVVVRDPPNDDIMDEPIFLYVAGE